jgi:sugar phosphate isomerase/epimerase
MRFCELGRGNVGLDWAVILHALDEEKYGGWLVVEQDQTTVTPMYDMSMNREYLASLGYEARIRG